MLDAVLSTTLPALVTTHVQQALYGLRQLRRRSEVACKAADADSDWRKSPVRIHFRSTAGCLKGGGYAATVWKKPGRNLMSAKQPLGRISFCQTFFGKISFHLDGTLLVDVLVSKYS